MKRPLAFCLIATLLVSTAHQVPAPIQEESPTPAPAVAPTAEPQKSPPKPKTKPKPTPKQHPALPDRSSKPASTANGHGFAGTWVGVVSLPGVGNLKCTIIINSNEDLASWTAPGYPGPTCPATINGRTISWSWTGGFLNLGWCGTTLKLIDAQTAEVTVANNLGSGSPSEVKKIK